MLVDIQRPRSFADASALAAHGAASWHRAPARAESVISTPRLMVGSLSCNPANWRRGQARADGTARRYPAAGGRENRVLYAGGPLIDAGQFVAVTRVDGNRIVVRRLPYSIAKE